MDQVGKGVLSIRFGCSYEKVLRTDAEGQTVNTASYGAGSWQYAATDYNDDGQAVREWSTGDIDAIRDGRLGAPDAGTLTVYNTENPDMLAGTVVTDTYATARFVTLDNGTRAWARPKLHTDYDETAPAGVSPGLPTTQTATVVNPATTNTLDTLSVVKTSYGDAIDGDPEAGWNMGLADSTTTVIPGGTDIVSTTRYDAQGRVISQRCPASRTWQGFLGLKGGCRRAGVPQVDLGWTVPGQGFVRSDGVVLDPVLLGVLGEHDGVVDLIDVEPLVLQGPEPAFA